jgi:hypothetical protein
VTCITPDSFHRAGGRALVPVLATLSAFAALPYMWEVEPELPAGDVAESARAATGAPVEVVRTVSSTVRAARTGGRHLGFDTNLHPGDDALRAWRESGPYAWVGYYLPAPCHTDRSWSGKRETIAELGYGTAVIYVGQQTWGRTTSLSAALARRVEREGKTCDAALVGRGRGRSEADETATRGCSTTM